MIVAGALVMTGIVDGRMEEVSVLGTAAMIRRDILTVRTDRYAWFAFCAVVGKSLVVRVVLWSGTGRISDRVMSL